MPLKQAQRRLAVTTPLGEDTLVLTAFAGREEISRLFGYQLDMISDNSAVDAAQIVGKNVTFSVAMADDSPRYFNGFVSRFYAGDEDLEHRRNYRAEVVPWLWFLTRTSDCRIFQSKSAPDIIQQIFKDLGFSDFKLQLSGKHPQRDYCVQYRETDFNFVSRLMEEEGIFYFFKHEKGKHTLVLADQKSGYFDCPENQVDYPRDPGSRAKEDHITRWEHCYEFRTGKWAQTDYNFEDHPARSAPLPAKLMMTNENTTVNLPDAKKYEFYDYPGTYAKKDEGDGYTKLRMEEEEVEYDVVQAASNCRSFTPGGKFKIRHHIAKSEEGKGFAITSIQHAAHEHYETGEAVGFDYQNSFECVPDSVVFRPARTTPRPRIHGVQPAVVTGPAGEEIYPDKHGRVKVQFFWDREGKRDDKSSCWIRVSQDYAGKAWGSVTIPRIGQEVLVSFLEGDPDRPIITGRVYNADQTPPYPLPSKKMVSGLKSNSTPGGGGYNEYIFDDTKGNELIREHGQYDKDSTIEHDLREHVKHDRHRDVTHDETVVIGNDQTNTIHANRTETVDKNETITIHGARTETVDQDEKITINGGRTETVAKDEKITINGGRTESVANDETITINGGRTETVAKDEKITINGGRTESVANDENITINGGRTETVAKDDNITINGNRILAIAKDDQVTVQGGRAENVTKSVLVNAGDSIVFTTGDASIALKKDGTISISGKKISVNGTDISIDGSGQISAKASKDMVLKGQKILQN
jgi:type VI secretion system secreted protein VgrG